MTLYVHETGKQNEHTVVFLHGLGVSGWMWTEQIEALESEFHCLNIDLPGNGMSHETPWTSFADTAQKVAEVIEERAHGGRAHVVGLSLGGYSVLHLLRAAPHAVRSAIVSGVTTRPVARPWLWKPVVELVAGFPKSSWLVTASAKMMQLPEEAVPLYRQDAARLKGATVRAVYAEVLRFSMAGLLGDCPCRLLGVAGGAEARTITKGLPDFLLLPEGQAAIAPKVHHAWNAELPEVFTEMIRSWIQERDLPAQLQPV